AGRNDRQPARRSRHAVSEPQDVAFSDRQLADDLHERAASAEHESEHGSMRPRRGVALLAALWLVVAIAAVALQFSLDAHERRTIGILASERGIQRAAANGALALMQARLEEALRLGPSADANPSLARLRGTSPWFCLASV